MVKTFPGETRMPEAKHRLPRYGMTTERLYEKILGELTEAPLPFYRFG